MLLFETPRLIIRSLKTTDRIFFTELLTDQNILELIPQIASSESQISERFDSNLNLKLTDLKNRKCVCGIFEKGNPEMVGLSLFLINDSNGKELGYRFREAYWRKGFATETTKGMLDYYFKVLKTKKVTADVNIANIASIKVLGKFMKPVKEFFNERDNCIDRRYSILKVDWLQ
jgi:ribosomal-protein-alanine N-acetyltransferase